MRGARKHARPAAPPRQRAPASSLAQVNLLAALGIAVEFALHIVHAPLPPRARWTRRIPHPVLIGHAVCLVQVHAFVSDPAPGPAPAAAQRALAGVGSAVASGVCATKLLGVAVRVSARGPAGAGPQRRARLAQPPPT